MENKIQLKNVDIVTKQDGKDITLFPDDIDIIQEDKPLDVIDDTGMIWTAKKLNCGDEDEKPKKKRKWTKYIYTIGLAIDCILCFILILLYANMFINKENISLIQFVIFGFLWCILFGVNIAEWRGVIKDEKEK